MSTWDDRPSAVTPVQDALSYDATVPTSAMQAAESVMEPCGTLRSKATTRQTLTSMRAAYSLGTCREAAEDDEGHGAYQRSGLGVRRPCVWMRVCKSSGHRAQHSATGIGSGSAVPADIHMIRHSEEVPNVSDLLRHLVRGH